MSDNITYIIYETTNLVNGKFYIGKHKQEGTKFDGYFGSGDAIKSAIKKYKRHNFIRETLKEFDNEQDAYDFERLIVDNDLVNNHNCYNIGVGGTGIGSGKNHPWYGKHHTEESKRKISRAGIGRTLSEESKNKISIANKGKNHPLYGKKLSKETKKKMFKSRIGFKHSEESKQKMSKSAKGKIIIEKTRRKISSSLKGRFIGIDNSFSKLWFINGHIFYSLVDASPTTIYRWCNDYHIPHCYSISKTGKL